MKSSQYKRLYSTARWRKLRTMVLGRDPVCRMCNDVTSTVVDHIKPHKGDPHLFAAADNLQGLCKPCHDRHKARHERGRHGQKPAVGADGWPAEGEGRGQLR